MHEKRRRLGRKEKARRQETVRSVDNDPGYVENENELEIEAQGAQVFNKKCRESMFLLSCPTRGFRNMFH